MRDWVPRNKVKNQMIPHYLFLIFNWSNFWIFLKVIPISKIFIKPFFRNKVEFCQSFTETYSILINCKTDHFQQYSNRNGRNGSFNHDSATSRWVHTLPWSLHDVFGRTQRGICFCWLASLTNLRRFCTRRDKRQPQNSKISSALFPQQSSVRADGCGAKKFGDNGKVANVWTVGGSSMVFRLVVEVCELCVERQTHWTALP